MSLRLCVTPDEIGIRCPARSLGHGQLVRYYPPNLSYRKTSAAVSCGKKDLALELFLHMMLLKHMRKMKSTRMLVFWDAGLLVFQLSGFLFSCFLVFGISAHLFSFETLYNVACLPFFLIKAVEKMNSTAH